MKHAGDLGAARPYSSSSPLSPSTLTIRVESDLAEIAWVSVDAFESIIKAC
jgi:hypothetical protein